MKSKFLRVISTFCCIVAATLTVDKAFSAKVISTEKSGEVSFVVEELANLEGVPWAIEFIAADKVLYTLREGKVGIVSLKTGKSSPVSGLPKIAAKGQGGLLDVAVQKPFTKESWIYFTYSKNQAGGNVTALARAKLKGSSLSSWQDLIVTQSASDNGRHFGSRIAFDGEGHLFFTVGDRGVRPNGQDLKTHAGSVLRVTLEGKAAKGNPFEKNAAALPEIWSFGHRNPQGIAYDSETKRLWTIEHGPRGGDEINLVLPGRNYGWPVVSHGKEYWGPKAVGEAKEKEGMETAAKYYVPSIAPSSLILYSGKAFPAWKGNLFSGALKLTHINRVVVEKDGSLSKEERMLNKLKERIRTIEEGPEGWIYFTTDLGRLLRIRPA